MPTIRTFIAVELPPQIKLVLAVAQDRLKALNRAPVRWVDPGIIHLTIKFLGDIDAGLAGRISLLLEEATRGVRPMQMEIRGLGVFPNPRRVRVVWVGIAGEIEELGRLQKNIDVALKPLGFTPETRSFSPHLTLARVREEATPDERQKLGQIISGHSPEIHDSFRVEAVNLMKSQLTARGPIYTRLSSVTLK
jgi:2'-5' RNA ligase